MTSTSKPSNITWHESRISRTDRQMHLKQKGVTIWMTGLSASGKSTIASLLEHHLVTKLGLNAYRLDGDNIRHGLNKDLGFTEAERRENIRRIGEVAKLFADSTTITIVSFISPYRVDREAVRQMHKDSDLPFVEVFVDAPLSVVEQRDPKGLYQKARQGLIKGFTGIDDPYEAPQGPEIHLNTAELSVEQSVDRILEYLSQFHFI